MCEIVNIHLDSLMGQICPSLWNIFCIRALVFFCQCINRGDLARLACSSVSVSNRHKSKDAGFCEILKTMPQSITLSTILQQVMATPFTFNARFQKSVSLQVSNNSNNKCMYLCTHLYLQPAWGLFHRRLSPSPFTRPRI